MTEAEWLASSDSYWMLRVVLGPDRSKRKLRLYGCACCRRIWHLLADPRSRHAVEIAENYVDGKAKLKDALAGARAAAQEIGTLREPETPAKASAANAAAELVGTFPIGAANWGAQGASAAVSNLSTSQRGDGTRESVAQASLLRDIFGNPFRPIMFAPEWRTDTAVALARQMYESRDFSAMPILADALQDAGCDNADVLNHCREEGATHVRGCWLCDLVLGKE